MTKITVNSVEELNEKWEAINALLFRALRSRYPHVQDIDDVVNDSYFRFRRELNKSKNTSLNDSFMIQGVFYCMIEYLRKKNRSKIVSLDGKEIRSNTLGQFIDFLSTQDAILSMPDFCAEVFQRRIANEKYNSISIAMGYNDYNEFMYEKNRCIELLTQKMNEARSN